MGTLVLPADHDPEKLKVTKMGNFSQVVYDGELLGYIMEDGEFKAKGRAK